MKQKSAAAIASYLEASEPEIYRPLGGMTYAVRAKSWQEFADAVIKAAADGHFSAEKIDFLKVRDTKVKETGEYLFF